MNEVARPEPTTRPGHQAPPPDLIDLDRFQGQRAGHGIHDARPAACLPGQPLPACLTGEVGRGRQAPDLAIDIHAGANPAIPARRDRIQNGARSCSVENTHVLPIPLPISLTCQGRQKTLLRLRGRHWRPARRLCRPTPTPRARTRCSLGRGFTQTDRLSGLRW